MSRSWKYPAFLTHNDLTDPRPARHERSGEAPLDQNAAIPSDQFYSLTGDELAFFKSQTGIQDEAELKKHIIQVKEEALVVQPYRCISYFSFTKLFISRLPAYSQLLKLGKERQSPIFLDIGCCFGNDLRKAVADGFPAERAIGSDIHLEFWHLGNKLFKTSKETFPAHFIPGDALNPEFLKPVPPFKSLPTGSVPDLSTLRTLTPLQGRISAIHASAFFHVFEEAGQLQLAKSLAGLLSPEPGSVIFGAHAGLPEKGFRQRSRIADTGPLMFCHSPESWIQLWDGEIFEKFTVKVEAVLVEVKHERINFLEGGVWYQLVWSVTRL
ncbi:hypothetical protein WOLCODRAFT_160087 [Wolfiporia cocos MD-104 SS10]|uniref:Methyltransferase domain-containing protein n=1 Tax=Wolfiporia cocos (strain MD-104) TaxID=742152 RepID=A0A2H3J748_WOLCO|nr:hypothetical protein WOLCODRAFT_160087 [Wolfiporia cocos MD-104 SS10]